MRLATILEVAGTPAVAVVRDDRVALLGDALPGLGTMRAVAGGGAAALERIEAWADARPAAAWLPLDAIRLGPAVPDPGAIYTIGHNYRAPASRARTASRSSGRSSTARLPTSVAGPGGTLAWDRAITAQRRRRGGAGDRHRRDGEPAVAPGDALRHVFGCTCINDVSSRDEWLDGDQWLLGQVDARVLPGGAVDRDAGRPRRHGPAPQADVNGEPIQDGRTSWMRFAIAEIVAFLSRHTVAAPGRPHRDRHAGPARHAARARPPPRAGRQSSPSGSRASARSRPTSPDHTSEESRDEARDRVPGGDDDPRGRGVRGRPRHGDRARSGPPSSTARTRRCSPTRSSRPRSRGGSRRGSTPSSRRPSTTRCRTRTSGSRGSSTSGSRRSWRSSRTCARGSRRSASGGSCSSTATTTTRTPSPTPAPNVADRLPAGHALLPGQLLGRHDARRGGRVLRPGERPPREQGRDVRGDGDQPRPRGHGARATSSSRRSPRSAARAPSTPRSSSRRRGPSIARRGPGRGATRARPRPSSASATSASSRTRRSASSRTSSAPARRCPAADGVGGCPPAPPPTGSQRARTQPSGPGDLAEEAGRWAHRALERRAVDADEAEPHRVAESPLEVVEGAPVEVAAHRQPRLDLGVDRAQAAVDELDPLGVVVGRHAVLGDDDVLPGRSSAARRIVAATASGRNS